MTAEIILYIRTSQLEGTALRALKRELRDLARNGRRLVLDLSAVEQMSAECADLLLKTSQRLSELGGSLHLTGLRKGVQAFLELLRVHRVVEMKTKNVDISRLAMAA